MLEPLESGSRCRDRSRSSQSSRWQREMNNQQWTRVLCCMLSLLLWSGDICSGRQESELWRQGELGLMPLFILNFLTIKWDNNKIYCYVGRYMPNMRIKCSRTLCNTMINLARNCYYVIKELNKLDILLESKRKGNKCSERVNKLFKAK